MAKHNESLPVTPAEQAILTTLLYSDIFSFPLTKDELWKFLIAEKKVPRESFESGLQVLHKYISSKDGYFCLKNREQHIIHRRKHVAEVTKKMHRAQTVAQKIAVIPSVLFIGITGGLAAGNVTPRDDIDFVIIVKKDTLFVSRLLILAVLERLGVRRFRNQKNTADTICVNLLFDETAFSWFAKSQDIYTAREIAQIKPLFERNNTYRSFTLANAWVSKFLPNVTSPESNFSKMQTNGVAQRMSDFVTNSLFETFFRFLQMRLMKRHQTTETLTKHVLAFHPIDYRVKTLKQLRLNMRQLGLLTKF